MTKLLSVLLAVFLLTGISCSTLSEGHLEGKPWINPELPGNLPSEKPALEENYHLHVNYELYQNPPSGTETESSTTGNANRVLQDAVWDLVNTGETAEAQSMRILSSLFLDRERREKDGLEPLMEYVRRVRETKTTEELSALCRESGFLFGSPYATIELEQSRQDPSRFALHLYVQQIVPNLESQEDTMEYIPEVPLDTKRVEEELLFLGYPAEDAKQLTERLVQYDQQRMDYGAEGEALPGKYAVSDILHLCVPLYDQLLSLGLIQADETEPTVFEFDEPKDFQYIQSLYRDENLDLFQTIICLSMMHHATDFLDLSTYAKAHDISGEVDLKAAAFEYLANNARYLTEQAYADTWFSPEQRAEVKQLAEEYKQAAEEWMLKCSWLSEESRKNAAKKAASMKVVAAASEDRMDCEPLLKALSADPMTLLRAVIQYEQAERQFLLKIAGQPFDRGHRAYYGIQTLVKTDAVYDAPRNTIYLMAGILQSAMYNRTSRETLLATIGQTIGHELSHGFDPNGIQYDAEGANDCILTEEDQSKYQERAQRLVTNLSSIELADGVLTDGTHKLSEEAADLLGLRLTLELAKKTDSFDYDLFFRSLGYKFFRIFKTREAAMESYSSDPHPACLIRTNYTFSQFEEFYQTYPSIQEGTAMYYPPEKRETLW